MPLHCAGDLNNKLRCVLKCSHFRSHYLHEVHKKTATRWRCSPGLDFEMPHLDGFSSAV